MADLPIACTLSPDALKTRRAGLLSALLGRANGHQDVFANTSLLLAFADRVITDWAGPRTRIVRRKLTLGRPVYPGDQLCGAGVVTGRSQQGR